jgi:hypothetical protein
MGVGDLQCGHQPINEERCGFRASSKTTLITRREMFTAGCEVVPSERAPHKLTRRAATIGMQNNTTSCCSHKTTCSDGARARERERVRASLITCLMLEIMPSKIIPATSNEAMLLIVGRSMSLVPSSTAITKPISGVVDRIPFF